MSDNKCCFCEEPIGETSQDCGRCRRNLYVKDFYWEKNKETDTLEFKFDKLIKNLNRVKFTDLPEDIQERLMKIYKEWKPSADIELN